MKRGKIKTFGISGEKRKYTMQFPNQSESIDQIKCERCVKVFNSSVEKRVEKNALKMKSPMLRGACTDCTIVVQSFREN